MKMTVRIGVVGGSVGGYSFKTVATAKVWIIEGRKSHFYVVIIIIAIIVVAD